MKRIINSLLIVLIIGFAGTSCGSNKESQTAKFSKGDTIRILAIGNSFSEDAIEENLYEIAKAEGLELIIGNLYIGGCSLETHWNNITEDKDAYDYRKVVDGVKTNTPKTAISKVLKEEKWDFISIQQVSGNSGLYDTYEAHLPQVMEYVRKNATNPDVEYILHQTWAYAKDSPHHDFPNYDKDQEKMHAMIVDATNSAAKLVNIKIIAPSGTAIQNARTSIFGDSFCRDGYHLEYNIGRFIAACAWFEKLFDIELGENSYKKPTLSDFEVRLAHASAHAAVLNPNSATDMVDYKEYPANETKLTKAIYVDFGNKKLKSEKPWNNLTDAGLRGLTLLKDEDGNDTGIRIKIANDFAGINENGATKTKTILNMPESASKDTFWGNTKEFNKYTNPTGAFEFNNLDPNKEYEIVFFSSRNNVKGDTETQFTVNGSEQKVVVLNASNNTSKTVSANKVKPDQKGAINISVTAGAKNNHPNGFFYVNAVRLAPAS